MKLLSILKLFLLTFLLGISLSFNMSPESDNEPQAINWMTWQEAVEKIEKGEKKKIFIDIYTDWCGWCKTMDKKTFSNPEIAKYMNEHFYAVKMDAEGKEDIVFRDHTFKYVANGRRGYHELAASLLQGKMSYPTVVFMDEDINMLSPVPGYQPPTSFHKIMTFFGEEHYKKTKWEEYEKIYEAPANLE
ncbi:MAG: DUF255 domain-containing protein [Bacteroidota bacterium]